MDRLAYLGLDLDAWDSLRLPEHASVVLRFPGDAPLARARARLWGYVLLPRPGYLHRPGAPPADYLVDLDREGSPVAAVPGLGTACVLGWGRGVLGLLAPESRGERGAGGVALGLGLCVLTCLWTLAGLANVPLSPDLARGTLLPGLLGLWGLRSWPWTRTETGASVLVAASLILVWARTLWEPLGQWDSLTHWTQAALVMLRDGTFLGPQHLHPASVMANQDYPLLLPLAEWSVMALAGRPDNHLARLVGPVLYTALLVVLHAGARELANRDVSAIDVADAAAHPHMTRAVDGSVSSGYADVPLAFLVACFLLAALRWSGSGGVRRILVAAVIAGALVHTKREGIVLAGAGTVLLLLLRRPSRAEAGAFLAALAAVLAPWLVRWLHLVQPRNLPTARAVPSASHGKTWSISRLRVRRLEVSGSARTTT